MPFHDVPDKRLEFFIWTSWFGISIMQFSIAFKIKFMDRRTMLKDLALGSGLLLMPPGLSLLSHKKSVQIIVIGDLSSLFMKDFYKEAPNNYYTYIGW